MERPTSRDHARADAGRPPGWELARRVVIPVLVVLAILLALVLAYQLRTLLMLTFVALLFAAALHEPVVWLERHGVPRIVAVVIPFVILAAVVTALGLALIPPLFDQVGQLIEDLPNLADRFLGFVVGLFDRFLGVGVGEQVVDQITRELRNIAPGLGAIAQLPLTLVEAVFGLAQTLFLSALFLIERERGREWFLQFIKEENRGTVHAVGRRVFRKLGAYVRGQLLIMTVIGVGTAAGMIVLGVPFALPLGLFAFFAEAIPIVGPFLSAVPILTVAFIEGVPTGLLMLGWIVVVQQAESWILTPFIQGKVLSLSPIAVLLAVFAGGALAGIVGAVIAVPIVAVLDVLVRDVVLPLRHGQPINGEGVDGEGERDGERPESGGGTSGAKGRRTSESEAAESRSGEDLLA